MIKELIKQGATRLPDTIFRRYGDNSIVDRAAQTALSASEAGSCEREIWFGRQDPSVKQRDLAKKWGVLQRGHTAEAFLVQCWHLADADGWELRFSGRSQRTFFSECGLLSGTPDLVAFKGTHAFVVDVKCIDPRKSRLGLPTPQHRTQVIQNMELVFQTFTHLETIAGAVLYVNASDYSDLLEAPVEYDEDVVERMYAKAARLQKIEVASDTIAEGILQPSLCKYCPFSSECSRLVSESAGVQPTASSSTDALAETTAALTAATSQRHSLFAKTA